MKLTTGKVVRGNNDEQNKTNEYQDLPTKPTNKKRKKSKVKHNNKWKQFDLPVINDFEWNLLIPAWDSDEPVIFIWKVSCRWYITIYL